VSEARGRDGSGGAGDADRALADATVAVLRGLFALPRLVALQGVSSPEVSQTADALRAAIARARPPFSLQVFPDAVLRDRAPLWLDLETVRKLQQLCSALARWNAQELAFESVPSVEALIELARAVLATTHKDRGARKPEVPGLTVGPVWRPFAAPTPGAEAALDVFAHVQVARACGETERLLAAPDRWSWSLAQTLCFRIERCAATSQSAMARALEVEAPPWSLARRAVAGAFYAHAVLARLGVSVRSQRAALHATLALCGYGLARGLSAQQAARAALPALLAEPAKGEAAGPHRLSTCALLLALAEPDASRRASSIGPLVQAAYEVERVRCTEGGAVQLSRIDLHAWLLGALGREVHAGWGRALIGVLGVVPAGSHVLADGRLAVVVGPGKEGDALRPRVLLGGKLAYVAAPVVPRSALAPPRS